MILIASLLVFSGCKGECKADSDCSADKCYSVKCEKKQCVEAAVPNCCGNQQCEAAENKCSCSDDCGSCEGKEGSYLEYLCDEKNECATDIKEELQKDTSLTSNPLSMGIKFNLITDLKQPFNIDKDLFLVKLSLEIIPDTISEVKITRLELTGTNKERQTVTLGAKTVNKALWDLNSVVEDGIPLAFPAESEGEMSSLKLKISFEYKQDFSGQLQTKTGSVENLYTTLKFLYVNPARTRSCPINCDDSNPGTNDICTPATNYLCEHLPIARACGNYECEISAGENQCSCAADCGSCEGDVGSYMSKSCSNNACITKLRPEVTLKPITIFDDRNLGFFWLVGKYSYDEPFNADSSKFKLEFTLQSASSGISSPKITTVTVLDQNTLIAEKNVNTALTSSGFTTEVPVSFSMSKQEEKRPLSLKVKYEYTQTTGSGATASDQTKQGFYTQSLGNVIFINPD